MVSVIIPVYNTAKYLDASVRSIVNQTYKDLQIILIDDGAKDESPQMCDAWAEKDNRIQVIHKENEGLGFTRNAGLEVATGKYVCFFDSDDTLELNAIEVCVQTLEREQADACFYARKTYDAEGNYTINKNIPDKKIFIGEEVKNEFSAIYFGQLPDDTKEPFLHPSVCRGMFLREVIENNKLRFLSERVCLSEDVFFGLHFCQVACKIIIIPEYFYNYTYNDTSLTKLYNPKKLQLFKNLYYMLLEYEDAYQQLSDVKLRIQHKFISGVQQCIEMEVNTKKLRGWKETYGHIKAICNDLEIINIFNMFPIERAGFKRRCFIKWVLHKRVLLLCIFYSVNK